jgi:hypothetical protein
METCIPSIWNNSYKINKITQTFASNAKLAKYFKSILLCLEMTQACFCKILPFSIDPKHHKTKVLKVSYSCIYRLPFVQILSKAIGINNKSSCCFIGIQIHFQNAVILFFILLDLPTRAGSPQQPKPITVGPFLPNPPCQLSLWEEILCIVFVKNNICIQL